MKKNALLRFFFNFVRNASLTSSSLITLRLKHTPREGESISEQEEKEGYCYRSKRL